MSDITPIFMEDYKGDFELFVEACYSCYKSIWVTNPKFNEKNIFRPTEPINGKESCFWGCVNGHDKDKQESSMKRYETIPCLKEILSKDRFKPNDKDADIKWFEFNRKIVIFSVSLSYLVVLREKAKKVFFVTAYPVGNRKKERLLKDWEYFWKKA